MNRLFVATWLILLPIPTIVLAQSKPDTAARDIQTVYEYEVKPDHEAFIPFHPRRAPKPGPLVLRQGDRLAICGDSITEQKMYSRIIETYLTATVPQLDITVRQFGWSGETAEGFLRRMDQDCLTFEPTIATLCYGMNDARYRPFDVNNGRWYENNYSQIVQRFKASGARVVLGSPGCSGKIASWVKAASGTLREHNLNLCALRDIGIGIAEREDLPFADIFWPMYQAQIFAPGQHEATAESSYEVAGKDGIHPGWAGHVVMAYAFLRAMGLDGEVGTIHVDLANETATASDGHRVDSFALGKLTLTSERIPFCARGDERDDNSIRSGMTLVPFFEELNRFTLKATGGAAKRYKISWGDTSKLFAAEDLSRGINLAWEFPENPLCEVFDRIDAAVAAKQAYETQQIKKRFHSREARDDFEQVLAETEATRKPLAEAIARARTSTQHTLTIQAMD